MHTKLLIQKKIDNKKPILKYIINKNKSCNIG